jgi:hypothetical protein
MKEGVLKKEFKKKDVQRMRNIISKKAGDKTQTLAGWEKKQIDHVEGDVWEESGKQWTLLNGIKQTVTKMDEIKRLVVLPICCPKCKKAMKLHDLNKKMYGIHSMCFDCVIDTEAEIKKAGKWEDYVNVQMNANKEARLEDFEQMVDVWLTEKDSYVSEDGDVEKWNGGDKSKMYKEIKEWIKEQKEIKI